MNFKDAYKTEINNLEFSDDFVSVASKNIRCAAANKNQNKEIYSMNKKIKTTISVMVAIIMLTVTCSAVSILLLSPKEVATKISDSNIYEAFDSKNSILLDKTIIDKGYEITLLGIAYGKELHNIYGNDAELDETYVIASIKKTDGSAMTFDDPLTLSLYVNGQLPWKVNSFTNGFSTVKTIENGVCYYALSAADFKQYASNTTYLAVLENQFAPSSDIFKLNSDGSLDYAGDYTGVKAIFELPILDK